MSIQSEPRFVWDPAKAAANYRTHGIAFPEAATVLDDDRALTRNDPDSRDEVRLIMVGISALGRLIVVVWSQPRPDEIRLISAWKANSRQRRSYGKNVG